MPPRKSTMKRKNGKMLGGGWFDDIKSSIGLASKPIGQSPTTDFINLSTITARPYPGTSVEIKFSDGTIQKGTVVRDDTAPEGAQNITIEYDNGKTQKFTSANSDVEIKIGSVIQHYRGGKKRRSQKKSKTQKKKR